MEFDQTVDEKFACRFSAPGSRLARFAMRPGEFIKLAGSQSMRADPRD